jgi:aminoglycoside phosphotransferase family enzyme/predicted kinase
VGRIQEDLLCDGALPSAQGEPTVCVETHISWVFLTSTEAWKVKKPVDLGFLNFRTLEARKRACEAEILLNRRLTQDVYLEVVPVRLGENGRHGIRGEGETVDWAVRMRRLPDAWRADIRLARGELSTEAVDAIAARLASFHAEAAHDAKISSFGRPSAIAESIRENFAQTRTTIHDYLSTDEASSLERWQTTFLVGHTPLFEQRMQGERIRDGQGDLRLEHVYIDASGKLTILDCIEFNERFRFIDVCADLAFLSMDLAWHGRVDLAERLLSRYAREADDYDLFSVVDFYESYRACVRAKISTFVTEDATLPRDVRTRAAEDARRYFLLALSASQRGVMDPALVAVGGVIASGKSTVAECIARELGAPIVDADRARKHMVGVEPTVRLNEAPWTGAYDRSLTERVYREVLRRAEVVLASGRPVVIDASFRSRAMRHEARALAARMQVPFKLVECRAPEATCRARLEERAKGDSVSDGRLAIFDEFVARFEAVVELEPREHLVLETSLPREETLSSLRQALALWPRGLVA